MFGSSWIVESPYAKLICPPALIFIHLPRLGLVSYCVMSSHLFIRLLFGLWHGKPLSTDLLYVVLLALISIVLTHLFDECSVGRHSFLGLEVLERWVWLWLRLVVVQWNGMLLHKLFAFHLSQRAVYSLTVPELLSFLKTQQIVLPPVLSISLRTW